MRKIIPIIISLITLNAIGQTLKTFNGPFIDGKTQNGTAVYSYYEDPDTREYLKQGSFKYTFEGNGDYSGYKQTITGSFEKGLKHGTWTYTVTMNDFGNDNPYYTGTVSLVANYKNGYADGNWKEIRSYKTRKKYYSYGQYQWDAFGPVKTLTINMNFKIGYLVGAVSINDEFANFKASGSYDNNGLAMGTWIINDIGWGKNTELIYKDNYLYEFVARNNQGEVLQGSSKYQKGYDNLIKARTMSQAEMEESGINIDTICGGSCSATSNIQAYFNKLLINDYFLYDFIKGDLTYKEGIKGGCDIMVSQSDYIALSEIPTYKEAEELYGKNDLLRAFVQYSKIDTNKIKPSEMKILKKKLSSINIDSLVDVYTSNTKFFSKYFTSIEDSIKNDSKSMQLLNNLKILRDEHGWTTFVDKNGIIQPFHDKYNSMSQSICACPWTAHNFKTAKECFDTNKDAYMKSILLYTEYFYKMEDVIKLEKENTNKNFYLNSSRDISTALYNKLNNQFNTYDKKTLVNNIQLVKNEYNKAKILVEKEAKMIANNSQIVLLNKETKKKNLFNKYSLVLQDFQTKYNANQDLDESNKILNESIAFLDKIIALYSVDTKELEKQLKDAETVEQIKTIITK
jgi:hypothetical protein